MVLNSESPKPISVWRFWVPVLFQTALILAVPAQAIYTHLTGKTVILQTVPIDPYELLRGYSQTLKYDISSQDTLRKLPGWQELPKQQPDANKLSMIEPGTHFYLILKAPDQPALNELPKPWQPVAVSIERPNQLPANEVALKGIAQNGSIEYGLETYYIPEEQREQINADLRAARKAEQTQQQQTLPQVTPTGLPQTFAQFNLARLQKRPPVVMEIKVNTQGDAVPVSLWARTKSQVRNYRF